MTWLIPCTMLSKCPIFFRFSIDDLFEWMTLNVKWLPFPYWGKVQWLHSRGRMHEIRSNSVDAFQSSKCILRTGIRSESFLKIVWIKCRKQSSRQYYLYRASRWIKCAAMIFFLTCEPRRVVYAIDVNTSTLLEKWVM